MSAKMFGYASLTIAALILIKAHASWGVWLAFHFSYWGGVLMNTGRAKDLV